MGKYNYFYISSYWVISFLTGLQNENVLFVYSFYDISRSWCYAKWKRVDPNLS